MNAGTVRRGPRPVKVVVVVDGKSAIPVRALPYAIGWALPPDALAKAFAGIGHRIERVDTYRLTSGGRFAVVPPKEWEHVKADLDELHEQLPLDDAGYAQWRRGAPLRFPAACFVWLDAFSKAFGKAAVVAEPGRPLEMDVNPEPLVPPEAEEWLLEGFGDPRSPERSWPWGDFDTPNLSLLAQAVQRFWVNFDPSDITTAPASEHVTDWLVERGMAKDLAKAVSRLIRAPGIRPGPR